MYSLVTPGGNHAPQPPLPTPWAPPAPMRRSNSGGASGPNTPTATKPPPAVPANMAASRPPSASLGAVAPNTPTAATRLAQPAPQPAPAAPAAPAAPVAPAPFADPSVARRSFWGCKVAGKKMVCTGLSEVFC